MMKIAKSTVEYSLVNMDEAKTKKFVSEIREFFSTHPSTEIKETNDQTVLVTLFHPMNSKLFVSGCQLGDNLFGFSRIKSIKHEFFELNLC